MPVSRMIYVSSAQQNDLAEVSSEGLDTEVWLGNTM